MELLLFHVLVGGKTEDTIGVVAEALGLVKSQELEESAFIVFQVGLKLVWGHLLLLLQWLDASIILPYESLEFS